MSIKINHGYVTSYTKNSNGTFACTLISTDIHKLYAIIRRIFNIETDSSSYNSPSSSYNSLPTITTTINCIGILNTNAIISLKNPNQVIIMSDDNKYIFIPIYPDDDQLLMFSKILNYYLIVYSILYYNTNIPLFHNSVALNIQSINFTNPNNDSVYNSASYMRADYASYLIGINPPRELLDLNPNSSQWKDIAQYCLTKYNFYNKNQSFEVSSLSIPKDNGFIPNNICLNIDSTDVIEVVKKFDCRNVPNGTAFILLNNTFFIKILGSIISYTSYCSSLCCIVIFLFLGVGVAQAVKVVKKKR